MTNVKYEIISNLKEIISLNYSFYSKKQIYEKLIKEQKITMKYVAFSRALKKYNINQIEINAVVDNVRSEYLKSKGKTIPTSNNNSVNVAKKEQGDIAQKNQNNDVTVVDSLTLEEKSDEQHEVDTQNNGEQKPKKKFIFKLPKAGSWILPHKDWPKTFYNQKFQQLERDGRTNSEGHEIVTTGLYDDDGREIVIGPPPKNPTDEEMNMVFHNPTKDQGKFSAVTFSSFRREDGYVPRASETVNYNTISYKDIRRK